MRIANREELLAHAAEGLEDARADALAILERALDAVEPSMLVQRSLRLQGKVLAVRGDPFAGGPGSAEDLLFDLSDVEAVRCVAAGKAASGMLRGLQEVLRPQEAFAVGGTGGGGAFPVLPGGHPLPDADSCRAGLRALELAKATGERDLLVVLVSGGASAMLEEPLVPLDDLRSLTEALLAAGGSIEELNAVRKKLSAVKGGRLAEAARGRALALVLSDVAEDHASLVGSGPAAPDPTTHADAQRVLRRLDVTPPASVASLLEEGAEGKRPDTPKPGDPALQRATTVVVGSGALACHEAAQLAGELGYHAWRVREPLAGPAARVGWKLARMADEVTLGKAPLPRPACVLYAGETTVDLRDAPRPGRGGRNQEAGLAALAALKVDATVAFLATDGVDGPTDNAGALLDMGSKAAADERRLDVRGALARHDSASVLEALGDQLRTGPTGTNVADLALVLVP